MSDGLMNVEFVENGIGILAQTGSEHNNLVQLPHLLQKFVDPRSRKYMKMMPMELDLDRNYKVWLRYWFETAVNQSFIQIKHQAFPADMLRSYWGK